VKSEDWDKLLEQGLAGDPPRPGFREEVLADSVAAFVRGRRSRAWRRAGSLAAAAVLIGAVSFLLGRHSLPEPAPERAPVAAAIVTQAQGVTVPNDLVAWLDAARLFHQLGMPERMGRAVDRASRLLPADAAGGVAAYGTAAPRGERATGTPHVTSPTTDSRFTILSALALPTTPLPLPREPCPSSVENMNPSMAPPFGE
jgi:hypothetical protein